MIRSDSFAPKDLIEHILTDEHELHLMVKALVKQSSIQDEKKSASPNYAWLKSRHLSVAEDNSLVKFENTINKLSSESCAAIAVKLDTLTDGAKMSASDLIKVFQKLLEEQESIQLLQLVDKRGKKIQAQLGRRRATIAFISY